MSQFARRLPYLSAWRREQLRTTLWVLPSVQVAIVIALFVFTHALDRASYRGRVDLPAWLNSGSADAARQILTALAAAMITVIGLVFSVTIVALVLASTQFGPRILRNFVRDRGIQLTLGAFVATFVYAVLTLGSVSSGNRGDFVPHLSITVSLAMVLADVALLIFFIHHVATSIQLPHVIASIARDLAVAIDAEAGDANGTDDEPQTGPSETELLHRLADTGALVHATRSGYLQFVGYDTLVDLATDAGAVVQLLHRPGHFVLEGLPIARVWPPETSRNVARSLERAHATGAHRTLTQDLAFSIDQLVEIAIRALSPAVNDTFTALTCIDWLSDGLSKLAARWNPRRVYRDRRGLVRVLSSEPSYRRLVERSFDKIRQAGRGMPAVMIRQLDALAKVMEHTNNDQQRDSLMTQAEIILRSSEAAISEPSDFADVRRSYDALCAAHAAARTPR